MKQRIKLTENELHNIIKESVNKLLNEEFGVDFYDTLDWVRRKNPNMSYKAAATFADNIIKKRMHQILKDKTSYTPNIDNVPLKKRFVYDYRIYYGKLIIEILDRQTKEIYSTFPCMNRDKAIQLRDKQIDYIIKHVPTNTNFFEENINEQPENFKQTDMWDVLFPNEDY